MRASWLLILPLTLSGCALDNSAEIERRRHDDELNARLDRIEGDLRRVQAGFQSVERSVNEAQDASAQTGQRLAKLEKQMEDSDAMMAAMAEPEAPAHHPAHAAAPVVKDKSKPEEGEAGDIARIQAALARAGYNPGTPDGKMGHKTKEALMKFQKDNGIKADGVVGPQTLAKLQPYLAAAAAPAPAPEPAPAP